MTKQRYLHSIFISVLSVLITGCAQVEKQRSEPSSPTIMQGQSVPHLSPKLEAGCLLPAAEFIDSTEGGSIKMNVQVSEEGEPIAVKITKPSGRGDRDKAFMKAVQACRFNPAKAGQKNISEQYELIFSWTAGQKFVGASRCFPPEYPRLALRREEEGLFHVYFRRSAANTPFEYRVKSTSSSTILKESARAAVEGCLNHPEVASELEIGVWYSAPFRWKLLN